MQTEIVISGFGGQGVLFAGQVLSYAAMDSDKHVTWIPSYGPEMRGGTANCTVIVSEEEIGSPLVMNPKAAVVMNLPSLDKYEPLLVPDGVLIANASLIDREIKRTDLDAVMIPANEIAEEIGEKRLVNMIMLGALLAKLPVLPVEDVKLSLQNHLPERHQHTLPLNYEALHKGAEFALQGETAKV
ncbi:MAG: 2-oxoacid:ferredoxin oxidoreductase subunit gamma [Chloroflexi bacterium]|nr:MAG: 2-oxoacid:ferredoxin oxidoreductase subunit gamma [Chloroflexota bacterium]MBL1196795.1 2-oxoacid:ferredoxin oxidoreductase subunit gamma [Chloroflexota bacterium]NOH14089.1 2-oxoacid:acceptor oxidoreductase family protein [Chloroflexota bacterium]